jgi:hypothetical protein
LTRTLPPIRLLLIGEASPSCGETFRRWSVSTSNEPAFSPARCRPTASTG